VAGVELEHGVYEQQQQQQQQEESHKTSEFCTKSCINATQLS